MTDNGSLSIGLRITARDGVPGTIVSAVNEQGNVRVHWDTGWCTWSQARLITERLGRSGAGPRSTQAAQKGGT